MNATPPPTPTTDLRPLPDPAELAVTFPQYEIQTLLGRGGMGAVYRARHRRLDRLVAIKVLLPAHVDPEFAERFEREARALARLDHPGIVMIHDFGETDGRCYLVMEHVDGASLRELIAAGRMTQRDALALIPQICDALQYAHDAGVVHRDIKPENILVDQDGRAHIADFGLAKILRGDTASVGLTRSDQAMGTPHYMAPEQISAGQVDHRADIYSLGVLLYEMLTGELPIGRFPPPSAKSASAAGLDAVVMKSLESEPAKRYQQAREVKSDLEIGGRASTPQGAEAATAEPPAAQPPAAKHPHRRRSHAASAPGATAAQPAVPWGTWSGLALVFLSTFMSWGTIVPTNSDSNGLPAHLFGEVSLTAWNGHANGVPCWTVVLAAALIAALRTVRWRGVEVPRLPVVILAGFGLLLSAVMFLLLATAGTNASPGVGSLISAVCFATWIWAELFSPHAARRMGLRRR